MTEKDKPDPEDFSSNGGIKELKLNSDRKRFCIEQARALFADDEVMTLRFALGEGWSEKLPELAKKFSTLKSSPLDLILIVGPNVFTEEDAAIANRAWLNGLTRDVVVEDDEDQDDDDEEDDETIDVVSFVDIMLFFGQNCTVREIDEDNPTVTIKLYEEDDKPFEIWSLVEEKADVTVERKSAKRKGEAQRLKITSEILGLAKELFCS